MMTDCRLCGRRCGVDRTRGPAGACHAPAEARVFDLSIDWAGEASLAPCAIASLSGCNMACAFCIVAEGSQNALHGAPFDPSAAAATINAQAPHIRSFSVLGGEPTIHLPSALALASQVSAGIPFVWKTNACASEDALPLIADVADVVLADFKFGGDACAKRLAGYPDYTHTVRANLRFWRDRGTPLIVRHLLMPGHIQCCLRPVVNWMARELPGVRLSLMTGYRPAHRAAGDPLIGRLPASDEIARALTEAARAGVPLEPWRCDTPPAPACGAGPADEVWIDAEGRVHALAANEALAACLRNLQDEFRVGA